MVILCNKLSFFLLSVAEFLSDLNQELGCRPVDLSGFTIFSDDPLDKDLYHALHLEDRVCQLQLNLFLAAALVYQGLQKIVCNFSHIRFIHEFENTLCGYFTGVLKQITAWA